MPSPTFTVFASRLFIMENGFDTAPNCCQGIFQDGNFVVSWHVFPREFELFLARMSNIIEVQ
jgi:hypothetical protein